MTVHTQARPVLKRPVYVRELVSPPRPEEVFDLIAGDRRPFFLDSALVMDRMGRYSMLGSGPMLSISAKGRRCEITQAGKTTRLAANPFEMLREYLDRYATHDESGLPFTTGAVGFLGYDLRHLIERLPSSGVDDTGLPDMYFSFYDRAVIFDHKESRCFLAAAEFEAGGSRGRRTAAKNKLNELEKHISRRPVSEIKVATCGRRKHKIRSNFTHEDYVRTVRRAKEYIAAGDIFQVNLSQRFHTTLSEPPEALYRRLRKVNPAPFACYLGLGRMAVLSASPELFLRVRGRSVQTRPIKGTRPRGQNESNDKLMREELLASEKDGAELAMIVDLERNDLGRVCEYGSVRVTEPRALETYPTVHHLVATVEGTLHPRFDFVDLIKATFPGGSITGAPKIRAMEIIDELEPTCRNLYTGAIGCIGFDGKMELNIVIRTFLVNGTDLFFQFGGGIVADSEPEAEYEETLHKAKGLLLSVNPVGE